jgi:proteasome lid subunit RPN8/RPN11
LDKMISMSSKTILIKRSIVEAILIDAKNAYPNEGILILKGKVKRDSITIDDSITPFMPTKGAHFSTFPLYMMPLDLTVIGTAHSHPSGNSRPSIEDMNNFYGRIMIISAYPYLSERDIAVYDKNGRRDYEIV